MGPIRGNFCKHQIAIILHTTKILAFTLLEHCGSYYGSQHGGLDGLFTRPSICEVDDDNDDP